MKIDGESLTQSHVLILMSRKSARICLRLVNGLTGDKVSQKNNFHFKRHFHLRELDSIKDMVKGQFPFPLPLTVQFQLRHSVRQYNQINTQILIGLSHYTKLIATMAELFRYLMCLKLSVSRSSAYHPDGFQPRFNCLTSWLNRFFTQNQPQQIFFHDEMTHTV